jgi:hypothetical protein
MRGADAIAHALERVGARVVFTVSGNHVMSVFDALLSRMRNAVGASLSGSNRNASAAIETEIEDRDTMSTSRASGPALAGSEARGWRIA